MKSKKDPVLRLYKDMVVLAQQLADALRDKGWAINDDDAISCLKCGFDADLDDRFCGQCGEKLPVSRSAVDDLVEALITALGQQDAKS